MRFFMPKKGKSITNFNAELREYDYRHFLGWLILDEKINKIYFWLFLLFLSLYYEPKKSEMFKSLKSLKSELMTNFKTL